MELINRILNSFVVWGAWILIPFIMEVVPAVGSFLLLIRRWTRKLVKPNTNYYPEISIIVPVYNSEDTLFNCIKSIAESNYPSSKIHVFLVNNQGKDNSFSVFAKCQEKFPELHQQWLNSKQGKSRALNLALYNSNGKYIINIDSDGVLEPNALKNLVDRFEARQDINCMTGAILTNPVEIMEYKTFWGRLLRKLEYMEYAQAFLAGRSYASETNSVYTLSGAFSAFRKSTILKSRLYNTDTICEDTQLTFQMRQIFGERVEVCENAIFLVGPIEDVNKLYTQRQRWQRGSLEVAKMFIDKDFRLTSIFKNVNVKTLLYDHTFAFPRMIWYLAIICLLFMNYSGKALIVSTAMIFIIYIIIGYFYFFSAAFYLNETPALKKFYISLWYGVTILPFFNLAVFFIRLAGIINSIGTDSAWRTKTLSDEKNDFTKVIKEDSNKYKRLVWKITRFFNNAKIYDKRVIYKSSKSLPWYILSAAIISLTSLLIASVIWVNNTYAVGLKDIIVAFTGGVTGTGSEIINAIFLGCVLPGLIILVIFAALAIVDRRISRKKEKLTVFAKFIIPFISCVLPLFLIVLFNYNFDFIGYYQNKLEQSSIYEKYYVDSNTVNISPGDKTKNLIFIYLESMEISYADRANGGFQDVNLIPNLTRLAYNNTSFSNGEKLGGLHSLGGYGYTVSALFSTVSGVPYMVTIEEGGPYSKVRCLGDVLAEYGYNQEFLCGSESEFARRCDLYNYHGYSKVLDVFEAQKEGYIPADYYEWWGYEDRKLFDIAKDRITKLSAEGETFNCTLLTVDTHPIGGYVCPECGDDYDIPTANVVACTDRLVSDFVEWCSQQDFYEDTVIVMVGDHPRMDTFLVENLKYYDRTSYNVFINPAIQTDNNKGVTNYREYTLWDIYPTTLAAMGFTVEGERLGLGTNLFSGMPTLAEEKGIDWLEIEVNKESDFFMNNIVGEND